MILVSEVNLFQLLFQLQLIFFFFILSSKGVFLCCVPVKK